MILFTLARQLINQLVGIKMLMMTEHLIDQKLSLLGVAQPSPLQILLEPLLWRHRNLDASQRLILILYHLRTRYKFTSEN
jgi:hypothetical protein